MTGWLIALGVLVLLAIIPLGISAFYNSDGFLTRLVLGPVRLTVYPSKKKDKSSKKECNECKSEGRKRYEFKDLFY